MDNNQIEEELRSLKQLVLVTLVLVFLILILLLSNLKGGNLQFNWVDTFNISSNEKPKRESKSKKRIYLQDEEAIELYKKYSLERALYNRQYSREEILADPLKTGYLSAKRSIDGYVEYLAKENEKVFVVSETGAWYYWSATSTLETAIEEARTRCEQWLRDNQKQCYIIDINGVFLGSYKD